MSKARILIGTDFSSASNLALEVGINIARKLKSTPVAFHVHDLKINFDELKILKYDLASYLEKITSVAYQVQEEKMHEQLADWRDGNKIIDNIFVPGNRIKEFIRAAKENNYKMIVVGLDEKKCKSHFYISSFVESLVRASHIPILIVKNSNLISLSNILIPFSIGQSPISAIEWGHAFSQYFSCETNYVHAIEPSRYRFLKSAKGTIQPLDIIYPQKEAIINRLKHSMMQKESIQWPEKCEVIHNEDKKIRIQLSDYINMNNPDLVIMGTHAKKGIERMYLGSIAEWILRATKSSLLITKTL